MNKLNNFFNNWKGSNYFLTLVIGLSVVASTAAASGGLKNFNFLNQGASSGNKLGLTQAAASQGASDNNAQQSGEIAMAAPEVQNTLTTAARLNTQNSAIRGGSVSAQALDQTTANLTSDSTTPDAQPVDAAATDAATTTTSTNQSTTALISFNPQTLALHKQTGDCYVAYEGRVYDVSNQAIWKNCTYGVVGGADVTTAFPNAGNYFSSLPLVGTYYDPSAAAALANNTNTNNSASNNSTNTNANSGSNASNTNHTTASSTTKTSTAVSGDGENRQRSGSTSSSSTSSGSSRTSGSRHNDD